MPQRLSLFSIKFAEFRESIGDGVFYLFIQSFCNRSADKKGMNYRISHEKIYLCVRNKL